MQLEIIGLNLLYFSYASPSICSVLNNCTATITGCELYIHDTFGIYNINKCSLATCFSFRHIKGLHLGVTLE